MLEGCKLFIETKLKEIWREVHPKTSLWADPFTCQVSVAFHAALKDCM